MLLYTDIPTNIGVPPDKKSMSPLGQVVNVKTIICIVYSVMMKILLTLKCLAGEQQFRLPVDPARRLLCTRACRVKLVSNRYTCTVFGQSSHALGRHSANSGDVFTGIVRSREREQANFFYTRIFGRRRFTNDDFTRDTTSGNDARCSEHII